MAPNIVAIGLFTLALGGILALWITRLIRLGDYIEKRQALPEPKPLVMVEPAPFKPRLAYDRQRNIAEEERREMTRLAYNRQRNITEEERLEMIRRNSDSSHTYRSDPYLGTAHVVYGATGSSGSQDTSSSSDSSSSDSSGGSCD